MKKAPRSKQQSASWISLLIILFLELISFTHHIFNVNITPLFSIVQLIDDASIIITIISIILLVFFGKKRSRDYAAITVSITVIIIANKLYYNSRLLELYNLLTRDVRIWISIIVCAVCIVFFVLIIKKKKHNNENMPIDDNTQNNNDINPSEKSHDGKITSDNLVKNDSLNSFSNNTPTNHTSLEKTANIVYWITLGLFIVLLVWGITTHILFNTSSFIEHPPFSSTQLTSVIYFSITISAAVIIAMIVVRVSMYLHKKHTSKPDESSGHGIFSIVSAFLAIGIEVIFITVGLRGDSTSTNNLFINLFTDNILVSLLVLIILFFVIQIIITIVAGFFNKITSTSSEIGRMLLESKEKTEKIIVRLVCGMIEGALNLLLIIPDFFDCIRTVLWENDDKTSPFDNQKPEDGSDENE